MAAATFPPSLAYRHGKPIPTLSREDRRLLRGNHQEKQRLFDRGHRWEPVVVEMLVDELLDRGHDVQIIDRNARYQDPEFPFLACELDLELLIDGEEHNAEIKTVSPFAAKAWGEQDTDEIPLYYAAQVMHGLMVKPRKRPS
ncbi:MAG: YqaJ viral recombinase family protein [Candidatus Accumulibacter sp.]|nr:YqaJ viral recombinase family protein [Accumulibacter sp.]